MKKGFIACLLLCITLFGYAQNDSSPYQAIVAKDGTGNFTSIQDAINQAPENSDTPWLILVKNGSYQEQVYIPKNKTYIHLIGQDKTKTTIHHRLNVGGKPDEKTPVEKQAYWDYSIHNPSFDLYKKEGTVIKVEGDNFYSENISYINDWGVDTQSGPQALAMSTQADCAAFYNCIFRSFQDTWMTSSRNDTYKVYAKDCWIEGAVDYFYGGGDALLENCTFYNVRSSSVIVAPSHKTAKYGYVFRNCIVDGNELAADGKQKLGRPWHHSPRAIYIHTKMNIPIAPEGWTNMGAIPALFAEYDSRDSQGNILDLSQRKTDYEGRGENSAKGSCPATITKDEASKYTYENVILREDNKWNPRDMMSKLEAPKNIKLEGQKITWKSVPQAIGYIVFSGDDIITTTQKTSYVIPKTNKSISICAINKYGSLGSIQKIGN